MYTVLPTLRLKIRISIYLLKRPVMTILFVCWIFHFFLTKILFCSCPQWFVRSKNTCFVNCKMKQLKGNFIFYKIISVNFSHFQTIFLIMLLRKRWQVWKLYPTQPETVWPKQTRHYGTAGRLDGWTLGQFVLICKFCKISKSVKPSQNFIFKWYLCCFIVDCQIDISPTSYWGCV